MTLKEAIKHLIPKPLLTAIRKNRENPGLQEYKNLSTQEVFSKIYENGVWGKSSDPAQPFFSGGGSHDNAVVATYIATIRGYLAKLDKKPNVVDLGCGDFFVGAQIRDLCDQYVACDIVPKLIEFNKEKFKNNHVDFRLLDITNDELPEGDIVFIRQVLQHLSNDQIRKVIPKLALKYKYLVITEHLPSLKKFEHNVDKPVGPGIRLGFKSGIVLTSPPFNLDVISQHKLCEVLDDQGVITTILYQLGR